MKYKLRLTQRDADGTFMFVGHGHRFPGKAITLLSPTVNNQTKSVSDRRTFAMSTSNRWTSNMAKDYLALGELCTSTPFPPLLPNGGDGMSVERSTTQHSVTSGREWTSVQRFMGCVIAGDATWQDLTHNARNASSPESQVAQASSVKHLEGPYVSGSEEAVMRKKGQSKRVCTMAHTSHPQSLGFWLRKIPGVAWSDFCSFSAVTDFCSHPVGSEDIQADHCVCWLCIPWLGISA